MRLVDASVALKWFVAEEGEAGARALIGEALCAPDLLLAEVSNAALKKWRRGEMTAEQVRLVPAFVSSFVEVLPSRPLVATALGIGLELNHPVYDCFYLAMCEATERTMVTADQKLIARCSGTRFEAMLEAL